MKKSELIHHRLHAMLREHTFHGDLEYLGERKSYKSGNLEHWYNIGGNEVPVDAIMELESRDPNEES